MIKFLCLKLAFPNKMETLPYSDKKCSKMFITPSESSAKELKDVPSFRTRPFYIITITIIFFLLLVSVSVNIVFFMKYLPKQNSVDSKSCKSETKFNEVCFHCKYFDDSNTFLWIKDRPKNNPSRRKMKEGKDVCCFDYTDSLHEMSKIFFLENMSSASYQARQESTRPMAHLTLNPAAVNNTDSRLRWNAAADDKTGTAILNHVLYADDKIVVPETGSYYVYSFITFRSEHIQNDTFLNHYIYKDSNNHKEREAEMVFMDKQMRQKGNLEYQTSLLTGIVSLKSHDKIFTDVSDVSAVYRSSLTNYMGLFKL